MFDHKQFVAGQCPLIFGFTQATIERLSRHQLVLGSGL
jgi:hypothetical protein